MRIAGGLSATGGGAGGSLLLQGGEGAYGYSREDPWLCSAAPPLPAKAAS